tara:strand:+ start:1233 stop:1559 length:327 start_codon:yes stop_codon:yes gene_type:complete
MSKEFLKLLKEIKYPDKNEDWDVEGILHGKTNRPYKFDLKPLRKFKQDDYGKIGNFNTKAEKMVFDFKDQWIILDIEELHQYIKDKKEKDFNIDNLMKELDWNMVLPK